MRARPWKGHSQIRSVGFVKCKRCRPLALEVSLSAFSRSPKQPEGYDVADSTGLWLQSAASDGFVGAVRCGEHLHICGSCQSSESGRVAMLSLEEWHMAQCYVYNQSPCLCTTVPLVLLGT